MEGNMPTITNNTHTSNGKLNLSKTNKKKLYIVFLDLHKKVSIFLNPCIITLEYNILETLKSFEYILSKILLFVEYCGKIIQVCLETYIQLSKLERTLM